MKKLYVQIWWAAQYPVWWLMPNSVWFFMVRRKYARVVQRWLKDPKVQAAIHRRPPPRS